MSCEFYRQAYQPPFAGTTFDFLSCSPSFRPLAEPMPPPPVPLVGERLLVEVWVAPLVVGPGNADRVVAGGTSDPELD
jgi:hypothetical protein